MRAFVVTPPPAILTLDEAKQHLKVDGVAEDAIIQAYIDAATAHLDGPDGTLGRALGPQTLELRTNGFAINTVKLPYRPIIDIVSVKFLDREGVERLADPSTYALDGQRLSWTAARPDVGIGPEALRIRYRAGYAVDPGANPIVAGVPAPIKAALLLMIGDLHANRETTGFGNVTELPMSLTVRELLGPYRCYF